ncbi:MAG: helix-turn-helix domain-containing protein [Gammaproteobacteria bacterium]|jgi:transposase|nr:helix-turn-helix domain-containing protein [Gammaproteobacteria bacterium]
MIDPIQPARLNVHLPGATCVMKLEALWLKRQGVAHRQISRLTGISSTTLTSYLRAYEVEGIEGLKTVNFPGSGCSVAR